MQRSPSLLKSLSEAIDGHYARRSGRYTGAVRLRPLMRVRNLLRTVASALVLTATATSCAGPTEPTGTATVDQFVQALQDRGLTVKLERSIAPDVNRFFSVAANRLLIDDRERVSVFEYPSVEAAAADAAQVSPDGQPSPVARFTWISTPRFYRQGRVIVFYVGCSTNLIRTLDEVMSAPFVIGATPCRE